MRSRSALRDILLNEARWAGYLRPSYRQVNLTIDIKRGRRRVRRI